MNDELTKRYYRIGDVSEMLDLPQSTLRFWEKEFGELRPQRKNGGNRLYTPGDVELLRLIKFLIKDKGLKIEAAKEHLRGNRKAIEKTHEVIRRLQGIRRELTALSEALKLRR